MDTRYFFRRDAPHLQQGVADPDRLAIMGQSYGAYCALAVITQTDRFKAAVISAAVIHPDLVSDYLEMSSSGASNEMGYFEHGQGNMGGTPWEYPERYLANSPVYLFDKIKTPLLIGQGEHDGSPAASDAIFVALPRLGKSVECRIYEKESHVIMRKQNVIDFWQRRLEFLEEHLRAPRESAFLLRHGDYSIEQLTSVNAKIRAGDSLPKRHVITWVTGIRRYTAPHQ